MMRRKTTPVPMRAARAPLTPTSTGTMIAPKASPMFMSDSSSEKTSASTSGGAARCSRMRPVTSRTVRPRPASASRRKALTTVGYRPRSAEGERRRDDAGGERRRQAAACHEPGGERGADERRRRRRPRSGSRRRPRPCRARRWRAPRRARPARRPGCTARRGGRRARARRLARARRGCPPPTCAVSETAPPVPRAMGGGPGNGITRSAATRRAAPRETAIASCGPPTPSSTPAIAGATSTLPFSAQLETTLAAVSSTGLRTMLGSSAACAGRGTVMPRLIGRRHGEDQPRRRIQGDRGGDGGHRDELHEVPGEQHAPGTAPVGQRAEVRRQEDAGDELHERHDACESWRPRPSRRTRAGTPTPPTRRR